MKVIMNETGNKVVDLSFKFTLEIIQYTESLEKAKKYIVSKQLQRSGTSIGADIWEAQNSESKLDFIHKFKIAAKEADETEYWLLLCKYSDNYNFDDKLLDKVKELKRIINKIISTAKTKRE
jgi:four helix bundle protein